MSSESDGAEFDVMVARNVMMPLRDGVRLATDVYLPARDCKPAPGERPAILLRTPYEKNGSQLTGEFYAKRGFVFVAQDVRGRFASEGEFYAFKNEGPDGFDTVEWVAAQPWCDGKIGTLGGSYCGAVQSALASYAPPHLSTMIVDCGPSSYYHHAMRHNGALEQRFLVYAFSMASNSKEAQANPELAVALTEACGRVWDYLKEGPIRPGSTPLRLLPAYEQWAIDLQRHVCYDDHWRAAGWGPMAWYEQHADVPTLYVGGWYDTYTRGTIHNFLELGKRQEQPVHLLMGPWVHCAQGASVSGDLAVPEGKVRFEEDVRLPWFERWLKGDEAAEITPKVRYFMMGDTGAEPGHDGRLKYGIGWRDETCWPPAGSKAVPFYLHGDGVLSTDAPAEGERASTTYVFDPSDPVPTIGGNLSAMPLPAGGFDQRCDKRFPGGTPGLPLSTRSDVLCFIGEPLTEDLEIAGAVVAELLVSSSAPDTDFTAKLIDVFPPSERYPEGAAINLIDSIGRLRFRHGFEREELAEPGSVCKLTFELYPTACRFRKGHQIRVDISSSNYPRFDVNPNTGGPLGVEPVRRIAENTVHHSPEHASRVVVTVLSPR